jgi:hypothetical protein
MTVNLGHVADVQKITVTLSDVTSDSGSVLADTSVSMNVLAGDVDASKTVDQTDMTQVRAQVGNPVTSSNFRDDVRADGTINQADVKEVRADQGHNLP